MASGSKGGLASLRVSRLKGRGVSGEEQPGTDIQETLLRAGGRCTRGWVAKTEGRALGLQRFVFIVFFLTLELVI